MPLTSLSFTDIGPFDDVTFEFNDHVNVFTGPNNSGKSSALWVLGELLVYPFTMPSKLFRSSSPTWRMNFSSATEPAYMEGNLPANEGQMVRIYEALGHACFVPAQRHGTNFRSLGPTVVQDVESRLDEELEMLATERPTAIRRAGPEAVRQSLRNSRGLDAPVLAKRRKLMLTSTSLVNDEAVIQKIVDLDYAAYRRRKPSIRAIVDKVVSMASEITEGYPMGFLGIEEDEDGLFPQLSTVDGNLPLDVLSQGTQSVIQWLARLLFGYAEYHDFSPDLEKMPGILIIDEIDAHLHPSWQRRIIPTLSRHFSNLQIFCSTHSPLMLAGLQEGQIQLLQRDKNGRVTVSTNERDISGWTSDEILRNILGVSDPTDAETAGHLERLQHLRNQEHLTAEEAEQLEILRHTVSQELISGPRSAQIDRFAEALREINARSTPSDGPAENSRDTQEERNPSK